MNIKARRGEKPKFELTKREKDQLAAACTTVEWLAKCADQEPLGDAALKACEGLEKVLELIGAVQGAV